MVILQINSSACSVKATIQKVQFLPIEQFKHNFRNEIENFKILTKNLKAYYIFGFCQGCLKMAAIPQGAFAACKLRENFRERDLIISRMKPGATGGSSSNEKFDTKYLLSNKKMLEYSPVKYNGKLMKSIWGLYNRYSPHNIKGNDDVQQRYLWQQPNAVAEFAIADNSNGTGLC